VIAQSAVSNEALRSFHRQLLEKALKSLETQTPEERVSSSDLVPIDPKYISEVKTASDRFTEELLRLSAKSKRKDQVYCLSVHFFSLTSPQKKRKPSV